MLASELLLVGNKVLAQGLVVIKRCKVIDQTLFIPGGENMYINMYLFFVYLIFTFHSLACFIYICLRGKPELERRAQTKD